MCKYQGILYGCGHPVLRVFKYCHSARNDHPHHQCFAPWKWESEIADDWERCSRCVAQGRPKLLTKEQVNAWMQSSERQHFFAQGERDIDRWWKLLAQRQKIKGQHFFAPTTEPAFDQSDTATLQLQPQEQQCNPQEQQCNPQEQQLNPQEQQWNPQEQQWIPQTQQWNQSQFPHQQ
jgi:hypothetical protein